MSSFIDNEEQAEIRELMVLDLAEISGHHELSKFIQIYIDLIKDNHMLWG